MASFKKLNTGWEYRLRYKDPFTQKFREKAQRGFDTKKEAQLAAAELEKKLLEGYEQTDITLTEFLDSWLNEYKKGTVRKNTLQLHQNNIKTHILPFFKNITLRNIKPIMYQKFLNDITDRGYSKRSVELVHSTMHNAMEKAVTINKLEKNQCDGVTIKGTKKNETITYLESDEIPTSCKQHINMDIFTGFF
ncbi:hypothetical protein BVG16_23310 [Paenibacillus selenitireducens]|uniref:Core-binding (CB) domain-containing protein n=1 Tax=Paenibacillus selenitireducens TaxID=1324314 RepID=A0A1T2X491_9BACL|nr:Arm DNA-binding domain-containing protein [Paenibacillus selenitireducens]OPA74689.1 hypothetical protein BVG16_23310 [Paenibacillus selenitireducens]